MLSHSDGIKLLETILKQIANEMRGKVDCIAMLETRGFIFAPMLALHLNIPCIPVSKKGNLPGPVIEMSYILEYGEVINYYYLVAFIKLICLKCITIFFCI